MSQIYVYDPTASDKLSKVRGVGRYMQLLRENFSNEFVFVSSTFHPQSSIFINPFFNLLQPPFTLKRLAKKQIAVIHDLIPLKYPDHFPIGLRGKFNIALNKLALHHYDHIVTDSEASKADIIRILNMNEKKITVIYPCLPHKFVNVSRFKFHVSHASCLYVGDATWNKNLVNLAKAIKIADVTCIFVGKVFEDLRLKEKAKIPVLNDLRGAQPRLTREHAHGVKNTVSSSMSHPWQKELREFAEITKDDKRFIFAGYIPDLDLIKLYQQATVNVLVSRDEGFGFSYVESSTMGCPSILSDIPVLREVSSGDALFINPQSPQSIADAIKKLFTNPTEREGLGLKAQQRARFFNQKMFKNQWISLTNK